MAELPPKLTMRLAPTAAKPPPLAVNCTWPVPLPKAPAEIPRVQFDHAAVERQIAARCGRPDTARQGRGVAQPQRRPGDGCRSGIGVAGGQFQVASAHDCQPAASAESSAKPCIHSGRAGAKGHLDGLRPTARQYLDRVLKIDRRIGRPTCRA